MEFQVIELFTEIVIELLVLASSDVGCGFEESDLAEILVFSSLGEIKVIQAENSDDPVLMFLPLTTEVVSELDNRLLLLRNLVIVPFLDLPGLPVPEISLYHQETELGLVI